MYAATLSARTLQARVSWQSAARTTTLPPGAQPVSGTEYCQHHVIPKTQYGHQGPWAVRAAKAEQGSGSGYPPFSRGWQANHVHGHCIAGPAPRGTRGASARILIAHSRRRDDRLRGGLAAVLRSRGLGPRPHGPCSRRGRKLETGAPWPVQCSQGQRAEARQWAARQDDDRVAVRILVQRPSGFQR